MTRRIKVDIPHPRAPWYTGDEVAYADESGQERRGKVVEVRGTLTGGYTLWVELAPGFDPVTGEVVA